MQRRPLSQRGFSLAEVLVASAIFTIIIVAALLLYDRSNQIFKQGSESADLQQNTRVAFDKVVADVRMAGFDYDRDGIPTGVAATAWKASTVYTMGDAVVPIGGNGFMYVCTQAGTSGISEPSWVAVANSLTLDPDPDPDHSGVTWRANSGVNQYQQPDEQIEYDGPTAITIRSNFDYDTNKANNNGRELDLEAKTPQFPVITTRNNEIVTYALVSTNAAAIAAGTANQDTATFYADVNDAGTPIARRAFPGGSKERKIDITGVDLTNNHPPYTLNRITINDDGTLLYTPLAENIRSMGFRYFADTTGQAPLMNLATPPVDVSSGNGGLGQFDPANPDIPIPDRLVRTGIRSVQVQLVGMSANPDSKFTDTASYWDPTVTGTTGTTAVDTVAPNYRKFGVSTLVVPRNLGKRGMRESVTNPPGNPLITAVCVGYCGIAKLTWQAPAGGGVSNYAILWDTASNGPFTSVWQAGNSSSAYLPGLTPNQPYYFKVEAINDYGAAMSNIVGPYTPKNATTPENPPAASMSASGGGGSNPAAIISQINLGWQRPVAAVAPSNQATCDPGPNQTTQILPAEAISYSINRATAAAGPFTQILPYTNTTNPAMTNNATGQVTWSDKSAANCIDYYYQVQAVKAICDVLPAYNTPPASTRTAVVPAAPSTWKGRAATTGNAPVAPVGLNVALTPAPVCDINTGLCTITLDWAPVTVDTAGKPVIIDQYEIVRTQKLGGVTTTSGGSYLAGLSTASDGPYYGITPVTATPAVSGTNAGATALVDNGESNPSKTTPPSIIDTVPERSSSGLLPYTYDYYVRAVQCGAAGADSNVTTYPCNLGSVTGPPTLSNTFQGNGSPGDPYFVDAPAAVTQTAAPAVQMRAILYRNTGTAWAVQRDYGLTATAVTSTTWPLSTTDVSAGTSYRMDLIYRNGTCSLKQTIYVVDEAIGCCLMPKSNDSTVMTWASGTDTVFIYLKNVCDTNLTIPQLSNSFTFNWNDAVGGGGFKISQITYPGRTGGTFNPPAGSEATSPFNVDTRTGSPSLGAATAVPALTPTGTGYLIKVKFNHIPSSNPITSFSVNYQRALIDLTPVSCQTVP
jgi:prepilin-type N-terminal cleavage/methylation domain-containing protein